MVWQRLRLLAEFIGLATINFIHFISNILATYINILKKRQQTMKITIVLAVLALLAVAQAHQQLRKHDLPFLDSLTDNPLKMAQLMSGDYVSILPEFLQPMARKIFNQEQSGTSALLSKASNFLGGGGKAE